MNSRSRNGRSEGTASNPAVVTSAAMKKPKAKHATAAAARQVDGHQDSEGAIWFVVAVMLWSACRSCMFFVVHTLKGFRNKFSIVLLHFQLWLESINIFFLIKQTFYFADLVYFREFSRAWYTLVHALVGAKFTRACSIHNVPRVESSTCMLYDIRWTSNRADFRTKTRIVYVWKS